MPRERIGLFGGTFDPPHVGHLILASEACAQLGLTRLLWMLTPTSPLKLGQKISPLEQRREMVERAIAGNDAFELSLLEAERPAPQYTLDTVRALKERNPDAAVILLIGGDSLGDLPKWHQPAELLAACEQIGVMRRPDSPDNLPELEKKTTGHHRQGQVRGRAAAGDRLQRGAPAGAGRGALPLLPAPGCLRVHPGKQALSKIRSGPQAALIYQTHLMAG